MGVEMTLEEYIKNNKFCIVCPDRHYLSKLRFKKDGSLKTICKMEGWWKMDKEKLLQYLRDIHTREYNALCGVGPVQAQYTPNVIAEIMNKITDGEFD